jgi:hypothetical protein
MANSVFNYLDAYCERGGDAGWFAEPLNLFTNLFFVVGAVIAARAIARMPAGQKRIDLWLLFLSMVAIGIGSGLWHLSPTRYTLLMDVIPIGLFINLYLISALRRLFHLAWWKVVAYWLVYTTAGIAAQELLPPDTLNGTVMYLPTYAAIIVMSAALWIKDRSVGRVFVTVLVVWTCSLFFRTIDMDICPRFHFGTHFLWHTLNAWVLWRLLMVLIAKAKAPVRIW